MAKPSSAKPEESFGSNSNTQIRQHNIFTKHYGQLTTLLFQANLTPHLIAEGVLVPADEEEINFASSSAKKAQIVLLKIAGSLDARLPEPFYKLITVMKSHGNHALKQLATVIENEIVDSSTADDAKTSQEKLKPEQLDISHPSIEFGTLIAEIAEILQEEVKSNLKRLTTVCYSITSKGNSLLFNSAEIAKIKACESVHDLFYELRGHWRYDDHPLLYAIVKQSGSKKAMGKLEMYRSKIKYHQKVQNIYDHSVSSKTPLPDGYTRMVAIVEKNYNEITKKEYEEIETMLLGNFGGPALRPPTFWPTHSTKIVWYIPTEAVGSVLKMAYHATEMFPLLSISFFEVDGVIIWNKKWPTLQELKQDNESKTVALSTKEETVTSLKTAIEKLESENQQLQKQETKDAQSTASKSQSLHAIKSERDSLRRDVSQMELTMKKLKNQLEATEKELQIFKDQKDEVTTSKASDDSTAVQDLNEKNSSLTKQLDQLHQDNLHLQDKNSSLQKQYEKVQFDMKELGNEHAKKLEEMSTEVEALRIENLKLKEPVSKDHGYHTEELDRLNEKPSGDNKSFDSGFDSVPKGGSASSEDTDKPPVPKRRNASKDVDKSMAKRLKEREEQVAKLQSELSKQKMEKIKGSKVAQPSKDNTSVQQKCDKLKHQVDELTKQITQLENDKKTLFEQNKDLHETVTQLTSDKKKLEDELSQHDELQSELSKLRSEKVQLKADKSKLEKDKRQHAEESEKKHKQIIALQSENRKLTQKKPVSEDHGYHPTELATLPEKPPINAKPTLMQLWKRVKEAESTVDALKQELHEQQDSYEGLMNETEETIQKLQRELRDAREPKTKEEKELESRSQRSRVTQNMYGASGFASLDFQQIMANRRQATDKEDTQ